MPIKRCQADGKPGFQWGNTHKCWTYIPGNDASKKAAKNKCIKQAIKIEGPVKFKQIMEKDAKAHIEDLQAIVKDKESTLTESTAALMALGANLIEIGFYIANKKNTTIQHT